MKAAIFFALFLTAVLQSQARLPRMADGRPDLQGIWDYATMTPLERPKGFEDRAFFTEAEASAFERGAGARLIESLPEKERALNSDLTGDLAAVELGRLDPSRRTSILVDPYDGQLPPQTDEAKARQAARRKARELPPDGPEALRLGERCLPDTAGPPILPVSFNSLLQIVQTPSFVAIVTEMTNEPRIVPLDGRPHLPAGITSWNGDSRGRWDGDTLVIDTTNFLDRMAVGGTTASLHVVERLTRTGRDALRYEFTVDEPSEFTRPWSGSYTIHRTANQMFEFACHEGNYSIVGMLRGARVQDR